MKKMLFAAVAILAFGLTPVHAESLTNFFRTSDFSGLTQNRPLLRLAAQDFSKVAMPNVSYFNQYFLVNGGTEKRSFIHKLEFTKALSKVGESVNVASSASAQFDNHTITVDIQSGYLAVKQHFGITNMLAHIEIYKPQNSTSPLVYSYSLEVASGKCVEYRYFVPTGTAAAVFEKGGDIACYFSIVPPSDKPATKAKEQ
jgi:hypothetical protein